MKTVIAAAALLLALSGCASREAYDHLARVEAACKSGDQDACKTVPAAKGRVQAEEYNAGARIGAPIGAVSEALVLGGAVAADTYLASQPSVIYVRPCRRFWC